MKNSETMITIRLRDMARRGESAADILRALASHLGSEAHKLDVIRHMREAFCLTLQQASPIAGWSADGKGTLQDLQLNALIIPEIRKNRPDWDTTEAAAR